MIKIGQDFSKSIKLNIFPFIAIPNGFYQTSIEYTTLYNNVTTMHFCSFNSLESNLRVEIGCDVYAMNITTSTVHTNSFANNFHCSYYVRVDRLILLNLIQKILKPISFK